MILTIIMILVIAAIAAAIAGAVFRSPANNLWGVIGVLAVIVLAIFLWNPIRGAFESSGGETNLRTQTSNAVTSLGSNPSQDQIQAALTDNGVSKDDATRIASASKRALDRGVSASDIATAVDNAKGSDTNNVVLAINGAKPGEAKAQPTAVATQPAQPTAVSTQPAQPTPAPASGGPLSTLAGTFNPPTPDKNLDNMPKVKIDVAPLDTWFHRVFNGALFVAPKFDGADSWFVTLALGRHSGGNWTSMGNPGQIVYRATNSNVNWCLGVLTTSKYKDQFLAGANVASVSINVRIAPNSPVNVTTHSGQTKAGVTSDAGDLTIILPDDGITSVCVGYSTAAPTHESLVWWGPDDRSVNINKVDAR